MATSDSVLLDSGLVATIERDRFHEGRYELVVAGTPQSMVNPADPTDLAYEYVSRIGVVIDLLTTPGAAITAVHFGAGAFTLPRYIEWTRPGSRQQVVELERALVDLVRDRLPLPKDASIRVRYGDARQVAERLPPGLQQSADLVVVDVFAGARIPAAVTSVEFMRIVRGLLTGSGVLAMNVADGAGLPFARRLIATVHEVFPETAVLAEPQVLRGRRFGNLVVIGSAAPLPTPWLPRLLAGGPFPAQAVSGDELANLIAGAVPLTDATAADSPEPDRGVFTARQRDSWRP